MDGVLDGKIEPGLKPNEHDGFLYIGGCDLQNFWMVGAIDEVLLFSKALAEEEIKELMEGVSVVLAVQPATKFPVTWGNIKNLAGIPPYKLDTSIQGSEARRLPAATFHEK